MDDRRFDSLVKALAEGKSRRHVLKGILGIGGAALTGEVLLKSDAEAARRPADPTPAPMRCPGIQIPSNGQCTCPNGLERCGPDCCATAIPSPLSGHSECCDNACCFGTCYGEELCCPTNNRSGGEFPLPPSHKICDSSRGPVCCGFDQQCCLVDGCCDTVCAGGGAFCCTSDRFCPGIDPESGLCCAEGETCCSPGSADNACVAGGCAVPCESASQCPGDDTECQTRTCIDGTCGMAFTANGVPITAQTAGDCKEDVCDGAGNIISIDNDSDIPAAQDECHVGQCVNGTATTVPSLQGTSCSAGVCDGAGTCVQCILAEDCPDFPNAQAVCNADHTCAFICNGGFDDCDGVPENGCETNILANTLNCGGCGIKCEVFNGTGVCVNGECQILACNEGFGDCDGNPQNGCETNLSNDPHNCGRCGNFCSTMCMGGNCPV